MEEESSLSARTDSLASHIDPVYSVHFLPPPSPRASSPTGISTLTSLSTLAVKQANLRRTIRRDFDFCRHQNDRLGADERCCRNHAAIPLSADLVGGKETCLMAWLKSDRGHLYESHSFKMTTKDLSSQGAE